MWLDGLYMSGPFYAEYTKLFDGPVSDYDDVAKQIRLVAAHTYDPATGLFYHAWDESKEQPWANKDTGTSSISGAGRRLVCHGAGGCAGLFPDEPPGTAGNHRHVPELCGGVVKYQDPKTGLWYQVLDQGNRKGNYLEATVSSMFVYAMAKGVNHGYLPRKNYEPVIEKGYRGIVENLVKTTATENVVDAMLPVAGLGGTPSNGTRDGSFDYYVSEPIVSNDLKGVGPFILAGIEVQQLLNRPAAGCDKACCMSPQKNKIVAVKITNPSRFYTQQRNRGNQFADRRWRSTVGSATGKFAVKDCATSNILDSQVYASEPARHGQTAFPG